MGHANPDAAVFTDAESSPRVAVIGAGLSGLACAHTLQDRGVAVRVFEKSRGVGGRMATRRTSDGLRFDHGAQYFTVRDARFADFVSSLKASGVVAEWEGRIATLTRGSVELKERTTPRFVGVPGMNALCRELARGLDIQFSVRVQTPILQTSIVHRPRRRDRVWTLVDPDGKSLGEFDCVISSAPAPQSAGLLASAPALRRLALGTPMEGCWAVLMAFAGSLDLGFDGAFVHDSPLSWVARNDSKPSRAGDHECWVLHATAEWTRGTVDEAADSVLPRLIDAFRDATGATLPQAAYAECHRWRFAIPPEPLESRCLFDPELQIGACGDWCSGPRVEGAYLSGLALASRVWDQVQGVR